MEHGTEAALLEANEDQAPTAGTRTVEHQSRLEFPLRMLHDSRRGLEPAWESLQSELESILDIQQRVERELAEYDAENGESVERVQHFDHVLTVESNHLSEMQELLESFSGSLNQVRDEIASYRDQLGDSRRKLYAVSNGEEIPAETETTAEDSHPEEPQADDPESLEIRQALKEMYGITGDLTPSAPPVPAEPSAEANEIEEPVAEEPDSQPESAIEPVAAEPEPEPAASQTEEASSNGVEPADSQFLDQPAEEPGEAPEVTVAASDPEPVDDEPSEEDDSVAAYMERLLQRNRQPGSATSAADLIRANKASQSGGKSNATPKPEAKAEPKKPPRKPREKKPQDKEKIRAGMSSMRELANLQARQAVAKHQWSESRQNMAIFGGMAAIGLLAAAVLLTAALWGQANLVVWAAIPLGIGGFAAAQFLRYASACRDRFLGDSVSGPRKLLVKLLHVPFSVSCRIASAVAFLLIGGAFFFSELWSPIPLGLYAWSVLALAGVFAFDAVQSIYETREQWLESMLEKSKQKRAAREEAEAAAE